MTLSISGKTALVTGAAHGIGRAIAQHFVERGARVMFADRDETALRDELGANAHSEGSQRWIAADLTRKLDISNLVAATLDAFGQIDILVNAHHVFALSDPLTPGKDAVAELWQQNVQATLMLSQRVAQRMLERQSSGPKGSIITLSSIAARLSRPELLGYSLANAALEQMTRSLALALAPQGVRVNGLAFGSVLGANLQATLKDHPDWREDIRRITPQGRIAAATELAEAAQFLASDGAGFVTGQILTVDGGRSLLDPVPHPSH